MNVPNKHANRNEKFSSMMAVMLIGVMEVRFVQCSSHGAIFRIGTVSPIESCTAKKSTGEKQRTLGDRVNFSRQFFFSELSKNCSILNCLFCQHWSNLDSVKPTIQLLVRQKDFCDNKDKAPLKLILRLLVAIHFGTGKNTNRRSSTWSFFSIKDNFTQ